jgi:hypothetical protein
MHKWLSEHLGNSCYTCTPNTWHLINHICNLTEYHYTYVSVHTKNICILIRLAWKLFAKNMQHIIMLCMLLLCFHGFSAYRATTPRTCFWYHETVYSLVLCLLYHGDLSIMVLTFSVHDFVMCNTPYFKILNKIF